ncbi:hypothetical protein L1049_001295 [Liquidambar formosana]|uniref:DUF4283 domain-containing protein n=1 Tax=Liquidambar formosana TaxID=63359 RepID=A0AAP0R637_LIQFO
MPEILSTDSSLFIFKFTNPSAMEWILESGPWFIGGKPLILRKWCPKMEMVKPHLKEIPIWVKLFNVPPKYWTDEGMSYVASGVGVPLYLDYPTETRTRLSFARACVEVFVDLDLPASFELHMGDGSVNVVGAKYPWKPQPTEANGPGLATPADLQDGHNDPLPELSVDSELFIPVDSTSVPSLASAGPVVTSGASDTLATNQFQLLSASVVKEEACFVSPARVSPTSKSESSPENVFKHRDLRVDEVEKKSKNNKKKKRSNKKTTPQQNNSSVVPLGMAGGIIYDAALPSSTKISLPTLFPNSDRKDKVCCLPASDKIFSTSSAWNCIRARGVDMNWHKLVWFPKAIRKHAFISWLAILDRMPTFDKLSAWGLTNNVTCVFCNQHVESRDHLFFACHVTAAIWGRVLGLCCFHRSPRTWLNELNWSIPGSNGKSFCSSIKKLAWASTIYNIWFERNG